MQYWSLFFTFSEIIRVFWYHGFWSAYVYVCKLLTFCTCQNAYYPIPIDEDRLMHRLELSVHDLWANEMNEILYRAQRGSLYVSLRNKDWGPQAKVFWWPLRLLYIAKNADLTGLSSLYYKDESERRQNSILCKLAFNMLSRNDLLIKIRLIV